MSEASRAVKSISTAGMIWGVLTIILGVVAIGSPMISGLAVAFLVAITLIIAGIAKTIYAFSAGSFGQGLVRLLFGGLTVTVGIIMIAQPGMALATLTLVLAAYFLADGVMALVVGFQHKPAQGWGWMVFNGLVTLALALMIIGDWPVSGVWAIGILVGVRLLFSGMTMLTLGSAGRQAAKSIAGSGGSDGVARP